VLVIGTVGIPEFVYAIDSSCSGMKTSPLFKRGPDSCRMKNITNNVTAIFEEILERSTISVPVISTFLNIMLMFCTIFCDELSRLFLFAVIIVIVILASRTGVAGGGNRGGNSRQE